jgi:hypothetical protein
MRVHRSTVGTLASWAAFDVSAVNAAAAGFQGATFDGRYVYLVPNENVTIARYDTTDSFGVAAIHTELQMLSERQRNGR